MKGVPVFHFYALGKGGIRIPLLNFSGSWVPALNFEEVPWSHVSEDPGPGVLASLLYHVFKYILQMMKKKQTDIHFHLSSEKSCFFNESFFKEL